MGTQHSDKITKNYSHRLPAIERFYREAKFSLFKSTYFTFPWFSQVPQSKFETHRSRGSRVMIGQTNRQTEITTLYNWRARRRKKKFLENIIYYSLSNMKFIIKMCSTRNYYWKTFSRYHHYLLTFSVIFFFVWYFLKFYICVIYN